MFVSFVLGGVETSKTGAKVLQIIERTYVRKCVL